MQKIPERLQGAIEAGIQAAAARRQAEADLAAKKSQEAALVARMEALEEALRPVTLTAWCADASEDAAGQVGTIEINGEAGDGAPQIIIAPQEVLPTLLSGEVNAREVQSGAQVFFNAAILPGWQKHMPTYRAGRIRNIDRAANTCTVDLDAARSSAESLEINQGETLSDVPVRYMTCDAAAFEDDDHVVVEFQAQDWTQPAVIGFVRRPRPCEPLAIAMTSYQWVRRGSPAEPEDDLALLPRRARWAQYDPATGAITNAAVLDVRYEFGAWVSANETIDCTNSTGMSSTAVAGVWHACMRQQYYSLPLAFGGKCWLDRVSSMPGETPFTLVAHDGTQKQLPAGMYQMSTAGRYIVGATPTQPFVVYDPQDGTIVQQHAIPGESILIGAYGGLAAIFGSEAAGDGYLERVRVIDIHTGETLFTEVYSPSAFSVADLALNNRHLVVLGITNYGRVLRLHDVATGEVVDEVPGGGVRAITMNAKYLVGVCESGEWGARQFTPNGGVVVFRVLDEGLSYVRTDYPFPAEGDAGSAHAG